MIVGDQPISAWMMNIKRGKRIFQNIIVAKGLLLNTAGERGEEIVRVGVLNAGKQAGECVTARSVRMLIAFFELTGRADGFPSPEWQAYGK